MAGPFNTFVTSPRRYVRNHLDATRTYAKKAYIDGPNGKEPAIGIFTGTTPLSILPLAAAIRLSNEIVDEAERHQEPQ